MTEIIALVNSIDSIAPFKVTDDPVHLVLEFVNVTALVRNDPEKCCSQSCRIEIVEPHTLIKNQPPGGYPLENRHVQMTCVKSAEVRMRQEIKFRGFPKRASGFRRRPVRSNLTTFPGSVTSYPANAFLGFRRRLANASSRRKFLSPFTPVTPA
jgi:hypothetical protein